MIGGGQQEFIGPERKGCFMSRMSLSYLSCKFQIDPIRMILKECFLKY